MKSRSGQKYGMKWTESEEITAENGNAIAKLRAKILEPWALSLEKPSDLPWLKPCLETLPARRNKDFRCPVQTADHWQSPCVKPKPWRDLAWEGAKRRTWYRLPLLQESKTCSCSTLLLNSGDTWKICTIQARHLVWVSSRAYCSIYFIRPAAGMFYAMQWRGILTNCVSRVSSADNLKKLKI